MAYSLQAFIGDPTDIAGIQVESRAVNLPQEKALLPITDAVRQKYGIPRAPLAGNDVLAEFGELADLPEVVCALVARAKKIAYVEAEFFGGDGTQAAAVWEEGRLVFGPVVAADAINQALRVLGVAKKEQFDEFGALNLGRHRDTDEWK